MIACDTPTTWADVAFLAVLLVGLIGLPGLIVILLERSG